MDTRRIYYFLRSYKINCCIRKKLNTYALKYILLKGIKMITITNDINFPAKFDLQNYLKKVYLYHKSSN